MTAPMLQLICFHICCLAQKKLSGKEKIGWWQLCSFLLEIKKKYKILLFGPNIKCWNYRNWTLTQFWAIVVLQLQPTQKSSITKLCHSIFQRQIALNSPCRRRRLTSPSILPPYNLQLKSETLPFINFGKVYDKLLKICIFWSQVDECHTSWLGFHQK